MKHKQVLIIIVNYGTENEIMSYVHELAKQTAIADLFLMVIDNKYCAEQQLETRLKEVGIEYYYHNPNKNLGYLNAALCGVDVFQSKFDYVPKWIVVSNTDISYCNNNFYKDFLNRNYNEDIWCVAPSVISPKNIYCNPHYKDRISIEKVNRIIWVFKHPILMKIYLLLSKMKGKGKIDRPKQDSQYVYSSHGCFFILRNSFYFKLNGEKYGALLYSEESFIAEFIRENNKKSFYDSSLEVRHNENLTTGKIDYRKRGKYISESMQYIKERFYEQK